MLSDDERNDFHNAVNALKRDTSVEPNKFDTLALIHTDSVESAHTSKKGNTGAGFLGWHRVYILMFETALREVNPSVCLPYWDSSLDDGLDTDGTSHIKSDEFPGTPHGRVMTGPFANWTTPRDVPLWRNVGFQGDIISVNDTQEVLSRHSYEDILPSFGEIRYRWEAHHNEAHDLVGDDMQDQTRATFDPVFYLLHAFVDFVWERFRDTLRTKGKNPELYPEV